MDEFLINAVKELNCRKCMKLDSLMGYVTNLHVKCANKMDRMNWECSFHERLRLECNDTKNHKLKIILINDDDHEAIMDG